MSVVAFRKPSEEPEASTALAMARPTALAVNEPPEDFDTGMRRPIMIGSIIVGVFVVGLGIWATFAPLGAAIMAAGVVKVEDNRKVIKQRDGGIISQVLVRNGQTVAKGDVLVKMDDVQARSAFEVYDN
ncbi:MAG: biotin/lipoyl-binding protein, partial [Hyphomicrobiales bacterium]